MGDEVQALKAGLLEVADIVVVTKADQPGADQAAASLRAMLTVGAQHDRALGDRPRPRRPEVLLVSARRRRRGRGAARGHRPPGARPARTRPIEHDGAALARAEAQVLGLVVERVRARLTSVGRHGGGWTPRSRAVARTSHRPIRRRGPAPRRACWRTPP